MKQLVIDDCLKKITNHFELCQVVAKRTKQLTRGARSLVIAKGEKKITLSMREIAEGKIFPTYKEQKETDE